MQITRYQAEDGCSGFTFDAAVAGIKDKGNFLFTGSSKLLGERQRRVARWLMMPTRYIYSSVLGMVSLLSPMT
jgi:hypothetical protein